MNDERRMNELNGQTSMNKTSERMRLSKRHNHPPFRVKKKETVRKRIECFRTHTTHYSACQIDSRRDFEQYIDHQSIIVDTVLVSSLQILLLSTIR